MKTTIIPTPLKDLLVIKVDYFEDQRGFFIEPWHKKDFHLAGLDLEFVQEGHSRSGSKVVRGIHYQDMRAPMAKLIRCTVGEIFDIALDLRISSKTFGKWFGIKLSAKNKLQLFVPVGFGHGFAALTKTVEVQYKQTGFYLPESEGTIAWDDPDIDIAWPFKNPLLSKRDQQGKSLKEYLRNPAFK